MTTTVTIPSVPRVNMFLSNGTMHREWQNFFRDLVARIGGISALSITEIIAIIANANIDASKILGTDADEAFTSIDLIDFVDGISGHITVSDDSLGGIDITISVEFLPNHILGTDNQITITDNLDGTITISIPNALITFLNEGLHILDTDASHDMIIKAGSDLTADRILSFVTGDAARTITLSGNPTLADWFDQAVKQASSPSFAGVTLTNVLSLTGDGRVINHIPIPLGDLGKGTSAPTAVQVGNYAGYRYTIGDDSVGTCKPTHETDDSEDIAVHVTWAINEAYATNNGEVQWQLDWSLTPAAGGEAITGPTHTGTIKSGDINIPATAYHLVHTKTLIISAANFAYDDVLGYTISRVAIDDGSDPTANPIIIEAHLEFTKNKLGTAI